LRRLERDHNAEQTLSLLGNSAMKFLVAAASILLLPLHILAIPHDVSSLQHANGLSERQACAAGIDNWGNCVEADRKVTTIRPSAHEKDDISADLLEGLKKANNGGLLHLEKGKKYIIGKKLDLSFLKDVYVKLDGEMKFTNDVKYWQANYFYYPFQKSITWVVWGGKDIKIYGSGMMNGNGQAWYDGFSGKEILVRKTIPPRCSRLTTELIGREEYLLPPYPLCYRQRHECRSHRDQVSQSPLLEHIYGSN
jgi:hypothetical protein